jgi:hypothetical protein
VKVEEVIDWVVGEVKAMPTDTVWRLNDNFIILSIEGVLSMLNGEGHQEVSHFTTWLVLATLQFWKMFKDVHKLARQIVQK